MIPVKDLYSYLEQMLRDRWGYIWGTAGVLCTESVINQAVNNPNNPNPELTEKYGKQWLGHMVSDCSGIMVYIWKKYGLSIPHGSSSMVRHSYIVDCGNTPHPGWAALVDPTPDTPDNNHIGIVGSDGVTVYECQGTRAGFVTSKVTDKKWTKFGKFKDVDYGGGSKPMDVPYKAEVATQSGSLNVRSGPGTEYAKVGKVEKGAIVTVKARSSSGWDFIDHNGLQGYASSQYLRPIEEPEPPVDDKVTITISKELAEEWLSVLTDICEHLTGGGNRD